jgi:hypothetical protein
LRKIVPFFAVLALFCSAASAQIQKKVTLTWQASSTAGVSYNVYREQTPGACTATTTGIGPGCLKLNATPLTVLTYVDATVPTGTSYYVVRALSGTLESVNSNEVSVSIQAPPTAPVLNAPTVQ